MSHKHRLWLVVAFVILALLFLLSWKTTMERIGSFMPQAQEAVGSKIEGVAEKLNGVGERVEEKTSDFSESYETAKESYEAEKARQAQEQQTTMEIESSPTYGKEVNE